ncbi:bifunctional 4-hydroxy-2-oxoglutarate aldolase/2-dehydro-3-deoxy-phosphogluconate aldolase [Stappia sp. F7233]|uniref:2-dehydro-3-deoxy-phosphogluconate aldolase n=1 Tax=Stappia albiluteola TaxID=2758565 RepID=A0A839AC10_9HYPH|nr:bifunctional 4-hydroxy-2-oxoglutarate aldolase/2-dehydro-3-deoxy-phosphogluconate aldolase [Stappia albiluteola]MBA5777173.1 bifunctional 4-hydroxy-2-oxoglutarate aldolase/2-dehydro-3-deoxy-phosphogluconate aldolase [Stappia albiluteola]
MSSVSEICALAPMIPVLVVKRIEDAGPLAKALYDGGLPVLEITLRTPVAIDAIKAMRDACPQAVIGAGTLRNAADLEATIAAGAAFGVSPGSPSALVSAVRKSGLPFLPGCATPTEAMELADQGFEVLKFFPAEAAGGVPMLKSMAGPLPDIKICPTGGVTPENAGNYLALPNVVTVGGSWVAPDKLIEAGDFAGITKLAREAVAALKG